MEEKTYAVFTAESVNAMAEKAGMSPVPHEAAAALGEDASYRMRQVIMLATQYMKHSKRRRLSVDDFNRAAKELGVMPVCGHGSQEPAPFRLVKDQDVYCVDDPEVSLCDIALGTSVPKNIGLPSIKAHWLAVEGTIKIWSGGSSASQGKGNREMSPTHLNYYNCMTKALLSQKAEAKKKALLDLKRNPNIVPMLPYLVNFVISGIKNMSHDMGHLTTMLNTIRALLHNRSLYLMHKPYLATMVQGVEFCVLEPLAASISSSNDQWVLRDYAARLLAEIVNRWNSPQNHLRYNTIKCLREALYDTSKPFYSHYGAVMAFIALGHKAVEDVVVPYLATYWPHLKAAMEDRAREKIVNRCDSHKVYGALRLAAEKILRRHVSLFKDLATARKERREVAEVLDIDENETALAPDSVESTNATVTATKKSPQKSVFELYKELYEYFGDSLAHCLPVVETHEVFRPMPREERVELGDANTGKSGEELLDNLMEQIYLEEKLEQERKERELVEQKEREKRERQRLAREAILRKKKEEEEKVKRQKREEDEQRRLLELDQQKRLREEEERRRKEWEEQIKELNKNRSKPEWQQEIELRRIQLEEEMQYSRKMEAKKRQEGRVRTDEEHKVKKPKLEEDMGKDDDEDQAGRSRAGLRRRKPVNYTEKDEDISDLFEDKPLAMPRQIPRLNPALPPHSDISDFSDEDMKKATSSPAEGLAVSKVIDPSKGLLKLKIKRASTHSSTPPHPMSATPQHTPSSYHSPSMQSPMYSPLSGSHSTPPPPPSSSMHHRSKSSSGSEKESKHKKGSGGGWRQSRGGSAGFQDISDPEEIFYEKPLGSLPPQLYSPGAESSGSDSNPHRKALKLKLKLTPKESASEGDN
ncbi:TAF6-like RNA polymerase II p300/CBP-associated factor-associated factor 65 kDa subunit 6L [Aplysia californica]|uniref:Histone H4 n=1 Tax=Aplysia californica TaxID=6500 RepID=A0ABM0JUN0_APLCA|nr:TAF6-like RNA polymerase II p300/CBP-associated factor-associated factor 65 kDa subunit 6L [Aplysia californica]XP_035826535.1 TAF6-like RNA polymerase II p300/CBP-associated factor-associated factor 65 kDa subunit 6L [Aplysia californica]XP_035826536.1 TAF6-like RNA polymerase II p300/CBP-associated factor-associated factor 65 kDa subunit 6L [Aplysia californica]